MPKQQTTSTESSVPAPTVEIYEASPGENVSVVKGIEKQFDRRMKYFKPELYLRYNSAADADADRADRD